MPSDLPPILVAEDDPNDFILFERALAGAGAKHPLHHFGNGAEVIQFLRETYVNASAGEVLRPRLLFLDLHIPQIDGCGVIAWVRRQPALAGLRIIVISGSGDSKDVQRAEALGANRILTKPPPIEALRAEIARLEEPSAPSNPSTAKS